MGVWGRYMWHRGIGEKNIVSSGMRVHVNVSSGMRVQVHVNIYMYMFNAAWDNIPTPCYGSVLHVHDQ